MCRFGAAKRCDCCTSGLDRDWAVNMRGFIGVVWNRTRHRKTAHLCVFELLFDLVYETSTDLANEATEEQFRPDFTRSSHRTANAHQRPDFVRPEVPNRRHERKVIKSNVKFP